MASFVFFKRRAIKLSLLVIGLILMITFLMPKPKGIESQSKLGENDQRFKVVFKDHILGNYEPPPSDTIREGPGEGGKPYIPHNADPNEISMAMMEYGINMVASDQIPLDRSVPDLRMDECKHWNYPKELPTTSVVIVFHNEGWSTLLRTVHSVLNRSPPQYLKEIVLIDDFSDKANLKESLTDYIRQFDGKVKLYRNKEREGLIRSRTLGAQYSIGDIVLFLDAHCEVNVNWLPPLVAPMLQNRTVMTVPVIDGIDKDNFEYRPVYKEAAYRGIFEWGMLYKETEIPYAEEKRRKHKSEPYKSPTHAGGLFAINREYFLELGAYDPGLLVWGGENFELSFKIWQCGGSIEWVPCSRVGHIYRSFMPYTYGKLAEKRKGPLVLLNYKRVVEVWMDEYKENFYAREPMARLYDAGDISQQLVLRRKLGCKNFKWFMNNVAYDVLDKFPLLPKNAFWGEVKSLLNGQCLDTMSSHPPSVVGLSPCHGSGGNQVFRLNTAGQLGVGERCVEADTNAVKLVFCTMGTVDGPWSYDEKSQMISHKRHKKCMEWDNNMMQLKLNTCASHTTGQKWAFRELTIK